jgi:hypothetical protein
MTLKTNSNRRAVADVWEEVEAPLNRYEEQIEIEVASNCGWSGELRPGLTDLPARPARSIVLYFAGGVDAPEVAKALLADAEAWLASSDVQPMAPWRVE